MGAQLAGGVATLPLLPGCGGGGEAGTAAREALSGARRDAAGVVAPPRTYATAAGATIYGGRWGNPLLELLTAAPENSWVQANTNTFDSVWPEPDLIAGIGGPGSPSKVIYAWASFAWDSARSRLVLYGGGHANYDGNEIYVFDGLTRRWSLAFHASDVRVYSGAEYVTVDGPFHSPVSAHTYDNNGYLQVLDRFITFGGAAAHSGGAYMVHGDGADRFAGPYTLDLAQAGKGMVGGTTGSNVQRNSTVGLSLPGANAWAMRDYFKDHPAAASLTGKWAHVSCGSAYRIEGGKDVIYKYQYFNQSLWRYQFNDADYHNDTITQIGRSDPSTTGWDSTCALDTDNDIFLAMGSVVDDVLHGYDLKQYAGTPIGNFRVRGDGLTGPGAAEFLADPAANRFGLDYDTINQRFVAWSEGGKVYGIQHGGGAYTGNWVVTVLNTGAGPLDSRPKTRVELDTELVGAFSNSSTSINGKWKWASDLNAFVGLQHCYDGNVWLYKPHGWMPPSSASAPQDNRVRALQSPRQQ